ncbi:MAG: prepilin peptidase [Janthinobacterium lividum]
MLFLIPALLGFIALYDFRHHRIPNYLVYIFLILSTIHLETWHVKTTLIWGIGFVCLKLIMERFLNRPALGWGDIKLMMVMGLWLPLEMMPVFLIYIGVLGMLMGIFYKIFWKKDVFPFAPALILGFLWTIKNMYLN